MCKDILLSRQKWKKMKNMKSWIKMIAMIVHIITSDVAIVTRNDCDNMDLFMTIVIFRFFVMNIFLFSVNAKNSRFSILTNDLDYIFSLLRIKQLCKKFWKMMLWSAGRKRKLVSFVRPCKYIVKSWTTTFFDLILFTG